MYYLKIWEKNDTIFTGIDEGWNYRIEDIEHPFVLYENNSDGSR